MPPAWGFLLLFFRAVFQLEDIELDSLKCVRCENQGCKTVTWEDGDIKDVVVS